MPSPAKFPFTLFCYELQGFRLAALRLVRGAIGADFLWIGALIASADLLCVSSA
jgi:hypothetical protein